MTKKNQNRISIFLETDVMERLDEYSENFADGNLSNNRSKIISDLIQRYLPKVNHD